MSENSAPKIDGRTKAGRAAKAAAEGTGGPTVSAVANAGTRADWRTKEARAARRQSAAVPEARKVELREAVPSPSAWSDDFMKSPQVQAALHAVSSAQAKRDSFRRKFTQGSMLVSESDLKSVEERFAKVVVALHELVPPDLLRHPACADLDIDAEAVIRHWHGPTAHVDAARAPQAH